MSILTTEHRIPTTAEIRHDYARGFALDEDDIEHREDLFDLWIEQARPSYSDVNELATHIYYALDSLGLTLVPRMNDQDEPDGEDLRAIAARLLGKDDE